MLNDHCWNWPKGAVGYSLSCLLNVVFSYNDTDKKKEIDKGRKEKGNDKKKERKRGEGT